MKCPRRFAMTPSRDSGLSAAALDSAARAGLISRMRNRLLPALPALLLALAPSASAAQTTLQLGWEVVGDSIANDWGASRVAFTLTNRGTKPLPPGGWAIYFNALHSALQGSVGRGFTIEDVIADLHRLAPAAGFAGLAPGASIRDRKSTRLNSSHTVISYAVFCLKKKNTKIKHETDN